MSDLMPALEGVAGDRLDRPDDLRENPAQSYILDDDAEIPQSGDLESGDGVANSKGVYYQMGDLVELT
jgi:hypothetical protein